MTGRDIYNKIFKLHLDYINSEIEVSTRPEIKLTTHQIFKLNDHLGWQHKYFNSVGALATGLLGECDFESVKITKEEK